MRVPQPTPRSVASLLATILVATMVVTYVTTPGGSQSEAKVSRLLRKTQGRPLSKSIEFAKSDSPIAGLSEKRKRSIFVRPQHGTTSLPGNLEIPAVGLDVSFREGVFDAVVAQGPGHWPGTPLPGAAGNSVFAGHRTTYTKPFADLDLLQKGDVIRASVGKGERVTYRVFQVAVIPEAEYVDFVLRQPQAERARIITLFACTPKGFRTHRIVVKAKAVRLPRTPAVEEQERGTRV